MWLKISIGVQSKGSLWSSVSWQLLLLHCFHRILVTAVVGHSSSQGQDREQSCGGSKWAKRVWSAGLAEKTKMTQAPWHQGGSRKSIGMAERIPKAEGHPKAVDHENLPERCKCRLRTGCDSLDRGSRWQIEEDTEEAAAETTEEAHTEEAHKAGCSKPSG